MGKKAKKQLLEIKDAPKKADSFKEMKIKDMTVNYSKETERFTLRKNGEFIMSCQNPDVVINRALSKA